MDSLEGLYFCNGAGGGRKVGEEGWGGRRGGGFPGGGEKRTKDLGGKKRKAPGKGPRREKGGGLLGTERALGTLHPKSAREGVGGQDTGKRKLEEGD